MSRPRGGFIGHNPAPAASAINSAAGGIWTLREAEALKRAGTWPQAFSSPTQISGLRLWLDASDASTLYDATTGGSLVAADGGVARWEDKSGNGNHATQGTAGYRPARKTAIQGGKDVLRFDGSDDLMAVASSTAAFKFLHDGDSTVFVVAKVGTSANPGHGANTLFSTIPSTSGSAGVGMEMVHRDASPDNDSLEAFVAKGLTGNYPVFSQQQNFFPSGEFGLVSLVCDPANATSANRVYLRHNGGDLRETNADAGANQTVSTANATGDLTFGSRPDGQGYLTGDVCEIIMYDTALNATDRAAVESYLMTKWGLT